jgi:uncharacterized RDD family membrane protein YckC
MGTVRVATNFNIEIDFISPPFHRRLMAWLLDVTVQIFYVVIATRLYYWLNRIIGYDADSGYTSWSIGLMLLIPFLLYHLVLEAGMNGQSIGKKLLSLRVISETGGRPSISQFIIRWLIRTSDFTVFMLIAMTPYAKIYGPVIYWGMAGALILLTTDLILVNSGKQQRLGDILAHTLVIQINHKHSIADTIFLDVAEDYQAAFPEVMNLSDRDINTLKSILVTARKNNDFKLAATAAEKIKGHLNVRSSLEPFEFLEKLLMDYNYLSGN